MSVTPRRVVREGAFKHIIADGVQVGDTIYLSGQVSVDSEGRTLGAGDIAAQVRQAYANVRSVLASFGASMADVVDETLFVTDIDGFLGQADALFALRAEMFGGEPQISQTLVQVARLGSPDWLIEIKCIARTAAA
ncbi:enamine deaminase RidA (YjgF/YER057c/UK114 family) [Variovorax boronicumulans]|uniref:Enamine deaminase RidA (YjgF/YER057c/UK114 family) n=1 Tax=Variovorax boronicumulans TaxID=436515 RepID=A0AAW8DPA4_9BURK|nr:RidA family protein [Variovorax boronicumulans]MDP9875992.1 enamine deaminase RidA (YjgF/YER057c/UK114 family) [Variovorax boronicumulans]MDP9917087.1 enamine deaminase RidA (YjgF/YER057c/UK114 family) [Variovorax boronicumulans]MDP9921276.1 enamine deaminase RidA (YjgF/YER057c/UK114 family) [Variovorax boronicumulans]